MSKLLEETRKNYLSRESQLYAKKDKLFAEGAAAVKEWELSSDTLSKHSMRELTSSKALAFPVMLPKVSERLCNSVE